MVRLLRTLVGGLMRRAAVGPLLAWTPRRSEGLGLGVEDGFMGGWPVARGPLHQIENTTLMLRLYLVAFNDNVHNKLQVMHESCIHCSTVTHDTTTRLYCAWSINNHISNYHIQSYVGHVLQSVKPA